MRSGNHPGLPLITASILILGLLMVAWPGQGRADNLFRFYPEFQASGFYSDNVPLRTQNEVGDFAGTMVGGFYLDFTSAERYASLHYDTFAQLFAHQTRFDRAGEGQFVRLNDDEHLSDTTKLRFDELFYRDSPTVAGIVTSDQSPGFNTVAAQLLLANDQSSINQFGATLIHDWGRNWASELAVHQTTFWNNGGTNNSNNNTSYEQGVSTFTDYHFSDRFSLGAGYRFYDFRFTFPGRPGEQAHWPFLKVGWSPLRNLYLSGIVGVVIAYTQGNSRQSVNVGGLGLAQYDLQRLHLKLYGGQQPELTSGFGGAGNVQEVRGVATYDITRRITFSAGGGYFQSNGTGFNGQLISWGAGFSDRLNKYLAGYVKFVQLRRNETTSSEFLPSGTQNGKEAVGDYFIVGFNASVEAFRWSWQ
jgi:hypothetical protein